MSAMMMPAIFDLEETLDCGQAFRWEEKDGHWQGFALGRYLQIERQGDNLAFHCSPEDFREIWGHYFDLDTDYTQIRGELSTMNPILKEAVAFAPGIHILNQDPWEALCSFILSQNNNIKRIKGIVARLCTCFGEPIPGGFAFPTPQALAACTPEDLAPIRSGFRAKYIVSAATLVAKKELSLQEIYTLPLPDARQSLMRISGVGPKVAECALLYGFHRTECFPMDVWMKRAMSTLLPHMVPEDFGKNAGIAQQYLFHYSRRNPQLFAEK